MLQWILTLWNLFIGLKSAPISPIIPPTMPIPPNVTNVPSSPLLFDTPQNARHSVRVMCDNAGLPTTRNVTIDGRLYLAKDIICACIEVESQFYNYLQNGKPVRHQNIVNSKLSSTDWGICQINDYFNVGILKPFPSVEFIMANPDKAVQFMINCYKAGKINLWSSYVSGEYKKHLPQNAPLAGR